MIREQGIIANMITIVYYVGFISSTIALLIIIA
jgi:hypothetical protein